MSHETEAQCLLRSGVLFARRAALPRPDGSLAFVGVKHGAFAIYLDDAPYVHFDLEGRWQRHFRNDTHYRKALDGSVHAIDRLRDDSGMTLDRQPQTPPEIESLDNDCRQFATDLLQILDSGTPLESPPSDPDRVLDATELREILQRIASYDHQAWLTHTQAYHAAYTSIDPLPPDAHQSLVLQADDKTSEGFLSHALAVRNLVGRRLAQCRSLFIDGLLTGEPPALALEAALKLAALLIPISRKPLPARRGTIPVDEPHLAAIDIRLNALDPTLANPTLWQNLATLHLRRINLPLSPHTPHLAAVASAIKTASLALNLSLTTRDATPELATLVESLPLDKLDRIDIHTTEPEAQALLPHLAPAQARGTKVVPYNPAKHWN